MGATYSDKSSYMWIALGDFNSITDEVPYAVRIIDLKDKWQLIRFQIKPQFTKKLMLVIQDFYYSKSVAGNYYIDNIAVTFESECS